MMKKILIPIAAAAAAMFTMTGCEAEATVTVESNSSSSTAPASSTSEPTASYCATAVSDNGGSIDAYIAGTGSLKTELVFKGDILESTAILTVAASATADEFDKACQDAKDDEDALSVSCDASKKTITVVDTTEAEGMTADDIADVLDMICSGVMGEEEPEPEEPEEVPVDTTITFQYKLLTYCEIYDDGYPDCEDTESKLAPDGKPYVKISGTYLTVSGDFDSEGIIKIAAYYGDDEEQQEIVTDYKYKGFDEDSLGAYWEFASIIDTTDEEDVGDVMRVYGEDFTVVRANDDSYYWSFSNDENLFKRINKKARKVAVGSLKKRH